MTARHVDSTAALLALAASVPDLPYAWNGGGHGGSDGLPVGTSYGSHYCEECQADYDACPRTAGDHDTCPTLCADCRERMGFVCADCAADLPDAEHADVLCDMCRRTAQRDARDERAYREAGND